MESSQDITNNRPLNVEQKNAYVARMKVAWAKLPDDKKSALRPMLDQAHQQYWEFVSKKKPPEHKFHNILRMKSYLTDDWDGQLRTHEQQVEAAVEINLGPEGEILGTGKYEQLDLCWELVAGTVWLENLLYKHPFPRGTPPIIPLQVLQNEKLRIALAGDFGTGNFGANDSPSTTNFENNSQLGPSNHHPSRGRVLCRNGSRRDQQASEVLACRIEVFLHLKLQPRDVFGGRTLFQRGGGRPVVQHVTIAMEFLRV